VKHKGITLKRIALLLFVVILSYLFIQSKNILDIAAGVAIFLFGMLSLEEGFRAFAGGFLEKVLQKTTNTLPKSIGFGIITTTLMQSSSLVSVISISFLSAGLISLYQGIGIILGANIGTTTGAWLVAGFGLKVDIATYAMPMLVFGTLFIFQSNKKLKGIGYVLAGLGFLFLGIAYMKDGFEAFKNSIDLREYAISGYKGLFIFMFIGIFATVVMQSSHATLVLIITALGAHQITYENALALAIGSNVGTTITAILGSLSSGLEGKKLAGAHVIFNVATGIFAVIFIYQFKEIVEYSAEFLGIAKDDFTLKLALFHTYFNIIGVILTVPLLSYMIKLLNTIFKSKTIQKDEVDDVLFLNDTALDFADTAVNVLHKEAIHLYNNVFTIISKGLSVYKEDITSGMEVEDIITLRNNPIEEDMDAYYHLKIKDIYGKIMSFAIRAQGKFEQSANTKIIPVKMAVISMAESFKATKHMQKNMLRYLHSDNIYIKEQYNYIRKNLIKQLRYAQMVLNAHEDDVVLLLLNKMELEAHKYDIAANKSIDNLIRNNQITYSMATSLMNDNSYASSIASDILKIAKYLYTYQNDKKETEAILLNKEEIAEVVSENKKDA
jgi:phosphate:Na+ symporter